MTPEWIVELGPFGFDVVNTRNGLRYFAAFSRYLAQRKADYLNKTT